MAPPTGSCCCPGTIPMRSGARWQNNSHRQRFTPQGRATIRRPAATDCHSR
jgi:hypothetical protein